MRNLYQGDCLEVMKEIPDKSIDLVLTDPPYGTVKGLGSTKVADHGMQNRVSWDNRLPTDQVFAHLARVVRKNGKVILFAQQPYTTELINSATSQLPFAHNLIWEKDHFANSLIAKKAPVNYFEDILVFSKVHRKSDFEGKHPLRDYFKQILTFSGLDRGEVLRVLGQCADHCFRVDSSQFTICTENTYFKIRETFGVDGMRGFIPFAELKRIDTEYRSELLNRMNAQYPSRFDLWEGKKFKGNILKYKKDYGGYHPTQKPVALMEDLVRTYTDKFETVLDFTMGSGTTGVAARNLARYFIGIELDAGYYEIAKDRIESHG